MSAIDDRLLDRLERGDCGHLERHVAMSERSWWKVGGPAKCIVSPRSIEELRNLRHFIHTERLPSFILGEASNLLFADDGVDAVGIKIGADLAKLTLSGTVATVQAGLWVPGLARILQQSGLSGLEHICGVPGSLGGLVVMNGGSMRHSIGDRIVRVRSVGRNGDLIDRTSEQCGFAYRDSIFQNCDEVIYEVELTLDRGDVVRMRREMIEILGLRRQKFPRKMPNCGSVFKSNPVMYPQHGPPGRVIEQAGWKGRRCGDALVSPLHANFIVNTGEAQANQILWLIAAIQKDVATKSGYHLEPEVRYVNRHGLIRRADLAYLRELENGNFAGEFSIDD